MTIQKIGEEIVEEFSMFDDWMDKYNYLIELGRDLELIPEDQKTPQNLITGCQSRVWLAADYSNGLITFKADSDAVITKGIVHLLIRAVSGHSPQEIIDNPLNFIDTIGLREHLSPTRANGLNSMVKQMKLYALAYQTKNDN